MFVTEDQAREKWCPYAISTISEAKKANMAANRVFAFDRMASAISSPKATMCVASLCMMWQWKEWSGAPEEHDKDPVGYCGLAGRP